MAETPTYGGSVDCFLNDCSNATASCIYYCHSAVDPFLFPFPPPPPPPSPPSSSSKNHMAPFLIATVSILGISFLLLSTCTIILRLRFTRRRGGRGVSPVSPDDSSMNGDGGDGRSFVDHPIWNITTVGLQQSVIDSITAFKYKKIDGFLIDSSDCSCSVCLTEFEEGDDLRLLPKCSHAFHVSCIDTWLRSHKTCPLCRAPIVNETGGGGSMGGGQLNSSDSGSREVVLRVNVDDHNGGDGSRRQLRERGDSLGVLPMLEGVKIAEILRKNRELRILSDLGENHRFRGSVEDLEPVRRSISFNAIAASVICGAVVGNEGSPSEGSSNEGSFRNGNNRVVEEKKIDLGKGGKNKRGSSMSGLLMKSSSIGNSLQKGPVSMKRSLSSSSKFFSFRRTRSQASILPL